MNASYNLALVEQRLILLAILEARESGKELMLTTFFNRSCGELYQSV